ncbi:glycosyltransferase, group 1 family protein [Gleimia coleocanis DSM 15436]|uniref:Glycosyltransferase, group 1 family protein n=1 Tax=Gleimia coleocanis DSM 15436 TaxID=525245 RepID=C0W158_9ACTO|nr:glycosyltransferase family 4 protein [Gleimia coleocanis]EEH63547.1 glycosyltransferase, group 1 family protein [Gleimia coleocanis DSM 15436]
MRIALVSDCFLPRVGGIETHVAQLADALAQAGHEVRVLTTTAVGNASFPFPKGGCQNLAYEIFRFDTKWTLGLPFNPFAKPLLDPHLRWAEVIHIHFGMVSPFAKLAADLCVSLGKRALVTWHSHLGDAISWYRFYVPFSKWLRAGFNFSAVSNAACGALVKCAAAGAFAQEQAPLVLPNPVDLSHWEAVRQKRALTLAEFPKSKNRSFKAVTAARLSKRKRIAPLLEVFPTRPWELTVYGGGASQATLTAKAARYADKSIHFAGAVSAYRLAAAYAEADCFVSLVEFEAFGIAALEARAAGLPVLFRRGNGIGDFITDGFDGIALESDASLPQVLEEFQTHPEKLRELQHNAANTPVNLSWEAQLPAYLQAYHTVFN